MNGKQTFLSQGTNGTISSRFKRTRGSFQVCVLTCSVMSDSVQPCELQPARLLCPQNFPGKNTGVGCHFLLQGIFLTQGLNLPLLGLLHWQVDFFLLLCHLGSPVKYMQFTVILNFLFDTYCLNRNIFNIQILCFSIYFSVMDLWFHNIKQSYSILLHSYIIICIKCFQTFC